MRSTARSLWAGAGAVAALAAGLLVPGGAVAHAAGTTYYVDCSAASDGSGSQTAPWNDLATVHAHVFAPGDQVLFRRGATCTGQFDPQGSGTAASPIVVNAYGTAAARPVIAGAGSVDAGIHLHNVEGWEINTLEVTNTAATKATRSGIIVEITDIGVGSHYVLNDVYVHDVSGDDTKNSNGIQFKVSGTTTPTRFDDVTVENSEVYKVDREGLTTASSWNCRAIYGTGCVAAQTWTPSTNVVFRNNLIHTIGGDGVVMRAATSALVTGNTAHDIWTNSAGNNAGIWTIDSDNTVISHNEVYDVHQRIAGGDGMAFDSDFGNIGTVIEHNYSHDNAGGFVLFCGCNSGSTTSGTVVRYNLSRNDGDRILYAAGETGAKIYNNTFYMPPGSTTTVTDQGASTTTAAWSNNIFYNLGTGGYTGDQSRYTWTNNTYYGNHPANEPADSGKLTSDPRPADPSGTTPADFKIGTTSPSRGNGAVMAGNGGVDYFGAALPQRCAPDRGFAQVSAFDDATCSAADLVGNPGFETGTLSPWTPYRTSSVETAHPHSGTHDLLANAGSSAEQIVTVEPNTTYTLSGWSKVSAAGVQTVIGVKLYGGPEVRTPEFTGTDYTQKSVTFTTGASNTKATIYCFNHIGSGPAYCDDLAVTRQ